MAEAEDVVQKIAKWNGKKIPANFLQACMEQQQKLTGNKYLKEEVSLQKLASYPNLLKKVLVVTFSWTANTMVYNGLSLATSTMNISDYLSFAISGAVEVPGVLLAWAFMDKYGRRPLQSHMLSKRPSRLGVSEPRPTVLPMEPGPQPACCYWRKYKRVRKGTMTLAMI